MPTSAVPFMHPDDIGKLYVPGSMRSGMPIVPNYAADEDGVDTVKVLLATDHFIMFESFRPKGAIDTAHQHPDHYSICYQKQGRVRMRIGDDWFVVESGDSYFHPIGVVHQHEALEDSVRIETKVYPEGGAVEAWKRLVGEPVASGHAGGSAGAEIRAERATKARATMKRGKRTCKAPKPNLDK